MVSMKDLAKICGVSVATVSKALNDYSDVGEDTKRRVREAAEAAGYLPNTVVRAAKMNRSWNLGILYADEAQSGLTHDFFSPVLDSFRRQAEHRGYDITFINKHLADQRMSYYEYCRFRQVDGVLIACTDFYNADVQALIRSDVPVVTLDHVFDNRIAVVSDNVKGMTTLINYVYSMGHTKIAYIHGADSSVTRSRKGSFYRSLAEHGIEIPDAYIRESDYRDTAAARAITRELLELPDPPTCIFYPDDYAALGGMRAIREKGLKVPDDISIVGYDGIPIDRILRPKLTTIHQATTEIGKIAAEQLVGLIEKPKTTLIERILVEGAFVQGDSVRRIG
ncbi:MAG: LacI family transcriptional regulator [Lachnospiraceae bacterium]|nr:LacI family transcriptional regulator [Lachnospiraceae bacterium]